MSRYPLNNGLTLEFSDYSRPIAADRWCVLLEVRIAIPIRPDTLPPELRGQADQVKEALGDEIIFSHKGERRFSCLHARGGEPEGKTDRVSP